MHARHLAFCAIFLLAPLVHADEGMWTFDSFPAKEVKTKYGFEPTQPFLDHLRLSSAKLGGCSASFVSANGLVMTNHHCAHECIAQLSTAKKDYVDTGFFAKTQADEVKCPTLEVTQLQSITDVTERMGKATKGLSGQAYAEARKSEMSRIEKECATADDVRCDVVTLYEGGRYVLHKAKRYQDVRLVFAPELSIAFFGGDPDNFEFPRYDLDVSFVRVYEGGKPAKPSDHFAWSTKNAKEGDLSFVSGHPGRTSRQKTMAQLETIRDLALPKRLLYMEEWRGQTLQFEEKSPEAHRIAKTQRFYIENDVKRGRGRWATLVDKAFMATKSDAERALWAKTASDPVLKNTHAGAWAAIAKAESDYRNFYDEYLYLEGERHGVEGTWAFRSDLFGIARALVRAADELPKPNEKRFREFAASNLTALEQDLFSDAPIYDELEIFDLTFSLTKLREALGADHPIVKKLFGKESPKSIATRLVKGTKLKDVAARKALYSGGKKAIDASTDPFVLFAKLVDADARAVRTKYETLVEGPETKAGQQIAEARFALQGASTYPDATGTLRLSFGRIEGWKEKGKTIAPITTFGGAFERHTGEEPFALPKTWLDAKSKLDLKTPLDFVSTNDIIGGNSGSPVINQAGEIIGLIFDGNFLSLGGDFGFDPAVNRAVSVHSAALIQALEKIYGAQRIADELRAK